MTSVLMKRTIHLCLTLAMLLLTATATATPHNSDDPSMHVGRWGQYGTLQGGSDWLHQEFQTQAMQRRQKQSLLDKIRKLHLGSDAAQTHKKWIPSRSNQDEVDRMANTWAMPSRLTESGIPPIVIQVPMRHSETKTYQALLKQEYRSRLSTTLEPHLTMEHKPMADHPVPKAYLQRVKSLVKIAGFDWVALASPTVFPDRHLLHANSDVVARLFLEQLHAEGRLDSEETLQGANPLSMDLLPPPRPDHLGKIQQTLRDEQAMRPDEPQSRFDEIMRGHTLRANLHDKWNQDWTSWADRAVQHKTAAAATGGDGSTKHHTHHKKPKTSWQRRVSVAEALRTALVDQSQGQITFAEAQHPRARSLRIGRQPHAWQHYRERWDMNPGQDKRPARNLDADPRKRAVNDPMLTEEWSVYDAAAWGDLPEGIYLHRPSLSAGPQVWDALGFDGAGIGIGVVDTGIELSHPELIHRYLRATSYDALNPGRNRPPLPVDPWQETHGTQASGVALAERGNHVCGAGVAPQARLGAIRLLGLRSPTDNEEAAALSHACRPHGSHPTQHVMINHVYSCSWGPIDDAGDLRGPGRLAAEAMDVCVHRDGRGGKGSIYVWAGGNGRTSGDNGNFDGYANRPETIAVGALDDLRHQAWYSEPCACLLVVAPSSGGSSGIVTSDPTGPAGLGEGRCTNGFGGTSAAAPAVAGVVALMLQAAPDLGWRDVQHILVRTSSKVDPRDRREPWTRNEAGHWHSHGFGFGLVNATKAVVLSTAWRPLEPRQALHYKGPHVTAAQTWHRAHAENQRTVEVPDQEGELLRIETADYHPATGNHAASEVAHWDRSQQVAASEPLAGDPDDPGLSKLASPTPASMPMENPLKTTALFMTRLLGRGARHLAAKVRALSDRKQAAMRFALREMAPNQVRLLHHNQVAIPPGMSAHFEWDWPTGQSDTNHVDILEHLGLNLDVLTPAGRGLLRIWLCSPSGTCSLMAPAPHERDGHRSIQGDRWTFWSVRHWDEKPLYAQDRTGHGKATWSLRLSHVWSTVPKLAHDLKNLRVKHPERVDVVLRWWGLQAYGTRSHTV